MNPAARVIVNGDEVVFTATERRVNAGESDPLCWSSHLFVYGETQAADEVGQEVSLEMRTFVFASGKWVLRYHETGHEDAPNEIKGGPDQPALIDAGRQLIVLIPVPADRTSA